MATRGSSYFVSTGAAFPDNIVANKYFEARVETSDEWIRTRTGISFRHMARPGEEQDWNSRLGYRASLQALQEAEISAQDLDAIIFATTTPDTFVPSTACWLQGLLGAKKCMAFDINAACSGFLYAAVIADSLMLASPAMNNVLVVGGEVLSSIVNFDDRNTCVLFGDGAGAAILSRRKANDPRGILAWSLSSEGAWAPYIQVPQGGSRVPPGDSCYLPDQAKIQLQGREVFRHAVDCMIEQSRKVCDEAGVALEEVDVFVPHQANIRIIEAVSDRLGVGMDKVLINLDRRGNTSSASIPSAISEAVTSRRIRAGQKILASSFGAGATFGAALVQT